MSLIRSTGRLGSAVAVLLGTIVIAAAPAAPTVQAASTTMVISQFQVAGGTAADEFVELHNVSSSPVDLNGLRLVYRSATGTNDVPLVAWSTTTVVAAGGHHLVAAGLFGATPTGYDGSPAADATFSHGGTGALAAAGGGLALRLGALNTGTVVDSVGYGSATNAFVETAVTAAPAANASRDRVQTGCQDTDDNANDFGALATSTPRNSASPVRTCGGPPAVGLSIGDVTLTEGNSGTTTFTFTVSLSAPAGAGGVTFDIATADNTATAATDYVAGSLTVQAIPAGSTTATFDVAVNGDTAVEPNETFFVNVTNVVGANVVDGQGTGTITNDDATSCSSATTPISAVQGSGAVSPLATQTVTVRGVVVGDFQGTSGLNGFNIQDRNPDADPATSEGIFVFVPTANPLSSVALAVGDDVVVTGRATEFQGLTELDNVTEIVSCSTGNPTTPTTVTLPETTNGELERYEGMLVSVPQTLTVQQNFFQGRYGQVTLGVGRLYQPTNTHPAGSADAIAAADLNSRSLLVLDDARSSQNPNPIPYIGADATLRAGDTITGIIGVIDFGPINSDSSIRDYRVQPTAPVTSTRVNARTATPPDVGGNVTVASFNVLNYFNGNGTGGGFPTSRGATTLAEFQRQRAKTIAAITALDADVVGLMEMENDGTGSTSAIQDLVDGLNAATAPGTYAFVVDPAPGTDEIRVALIYQPAAVTPVGAASNFQTSDPAYGAELFDRPPLAQTFEHQTTGEDFTVVVNHFKSKGSCPTSGPDLDQGDGQGCWNAKRVRQAQELLAFTESLQTTAGDDDVLVIGDLNSYGMEDPILELVAGGYVNQIDRFLGDEAYSYVFDGLAGYLDHALATAELGAQISGVAEWHINADEPSVIDYNTEFKPQDLYTPTPYRSSDHDPVVVGLELVRPNRAPTASGDGYQATEDTTLTVAAPGVLGNDSDPDDDSLTAEMVTGTAKGTLTLAGNGSFTYVPNPNATGSDSFTYRACDTSAACSSTVTVTIEITALTAAQEIARIEAAVQALRSSGVLGKSDATGLLAKLSAAKSAFARNKVATACNNLQAFVNQVVDLRTIGTLSTAQAAPLLAGANNLRQEYGC